MSGKLSNSSESNLSTPANGAIYSRRPAYVCAVIMLGGYLLAGCWPSDCNKSDSTPDHAEPSNPTVELTIAPHEATYRLRARSTDGPDSPRELVFAETLPKENEHLWFRPSPFELSRRLEPPMRELFELEERREHASTPPQTAFPIRFEGSAETDDQRSHPFHGVGVLPGPKTPRDLSITVAPETDFRHVLYGALAGGFVGARRVRLTIGDAEPIDFGLVRRYTSAGACFDHATVEQERETCWQLIERSLDSMRRVVSVQVSANAISLQVDSMPTDAPKLPGERPADPLGRKGQRQGLLSVSDSRRARDLAEEILKVQAAAPQDADGAGAEVQAKLDELRGLYPWDEVRAFLRHFDAHLQQTQTKAGYVVFVTAADEEADAVPAGIMAELRTITCAPDQTHPEHQNRADCGWEMLEGPVLGPEGF